jgi:hypothetical protein
MKRCPLLLPTLMAGLICGCATYGNKALDDPHKYLNVREGMSTKQDICRVFGQPHDVEYSDDRERCMWSYFKVESSPNAWTFVPYLGLLASGSNEDITKVFFIFGPNQRLIKTQTNKTSDSENSWAAMGRMVAQGNRDDRASRVAAEMAKIGKPFNKKVAHNVKFLR